MKKCQNVGTRFIACIETLAIILIITFLVLPYVTTAQQQPLPCRFHGTVLLNGRPVSDGIVVRALIGGNEVASCTLPAVYGSSTYALVIAPQVGVSYSSNTTINFKIHVYDAIQTATWADGGNIALNLTAYSLPTPTPKPSPTPLMTPIPTPSITPVVTPTPTISPTPSPTLTPTPAPPTPTPKATSDKWRLIEGAVLVVLVLVLVGLIAYLVWTSFLRR